MIHTTTQWDEKFFEKFISLSHKLYEREADYIKEKSDDFKAMLAENAPFALRNKWQAWIIEENGRVVGRVFASTRVDEFKQKEFLPFGYFEAEDESIAHELFKCVEGLAHEEGYRRIRGPIDGNVFNHSRFITKQTKPLFLGEPLHRSEYLDYFKNAGFYISQRWITAYFDLKGRLTGMWDYFTKFKKSPYRRKNYHIRELDITKWDSELKLIYELMMDSYSEMDDVELISFEEFKVWMGAFKFLINPKDCLILEYEQEALGFMLVPRDTRRQIARLSKNNNIMNKLALGLKLKADRGLVLINYLGKKRNTEGKVKGVTVKLFRKLAQNHYGFLFTPAVMGFMSEKSKSLEIVPRVYKISSEYCMFQKDITDL